MSNEIAIEPAHGFQAFHRWRRWGTFAAGCSVLAIVSIIAFWPVTYNDFTSFDDPDYITQNDYVQGGLTADGVRWAFTNTQQSANWHPLTWLSHMLDVDLFGATNAPAHHWMNVGLHITTAILLLRSLYLMTGLNGPSLFVALLFAVHPLRVESVAWASERKDVLSAFFWMLTLLAYSSFSRRRTLTRYVIVAICMAVGLLAKPMLITLPLALLLLDYWPLKRFENEPVRWLVLEKVPLLALSTIAAIVTIVAQRSGQAFGDLDVYPLGLRISNAIVSYSHYLLKTIWPLNLSPFYPHPGMHADTTIPSWQIILSIGVLVLLTGFVLYLARRAPYLLVGWFWYGVTLLPVIGVVQVGKQAMADRYTYIPSIGLYIMIAWGIMHLARQARPDIRSALRWIVSSIAVVLIALCTIGTYRQTRFWKNDLTLFTHALAVDPNNFLAYDMIGNYYLKQGDSDRAMAQYNAAQQARPQALQHQHDMAGNVYAAQNDLDRAQAEYERAIRLQPNMPETHNNLGQIYARKGDSDRAIQEFRLGIQYGPMLAQPYHNLALELAKRGSLDQAIFYWKKALELKPHYAMAHEGLGHALRMSGDLKGAAAHYRSALKTGPQKPEVMAALAWILATDPRPEVADPDEALRLAEKSNAVSGGRDALALDTLAAAQARTGRYDAAIESARHALELARSAGQDQLAKSIQSRIMLYTEHRPYLEAAR